MTVAAVGDLVSAATGGLQVDDPTAASLATRSGGNPFTLLQYLDAVARRRPAAAALGPLAAGRSRTCTPRPAGRGGRRQPRSARPAGFDGLDPDSRYLLGVGAVYGPVFDPALVADAAGLPPPPDARGGRRRRPGATWSSGATAGGTRFLHDRIREALLAQFDPDAAAAACTSGSPTCWTRLDRPATRRRSTRWPGTAWPASPDRSTRTGCTAACSAAGRLALADHAPAEALASWTRPPQAAAAAGISLDAASWSRWPPPSTGPAGSATPSTPPALARRARADPRRAGPAS